MFLCSFGSLSTVRSVTVCVCVCVCVCSHLDREDHGENGLDFTWQTTSSDSHIEIQILTVVSDNSCCVHSGFFI